MAIRLYDRRNEETVGFQKMCEEIVRETIGEMVDDLIGNDADRADLYYMISQTAALEISRKCLQMDIDRMREEDG